MTAPTSTIGNPVLVVAPKLGVKVNDEVDEILPGLYRVGKSVCSTEDGRREWDCLQRYQVTNPLQ
jgi:hypothetical protein